MKYLFDMGEVWHVYSDVGKQWIYQRLEQVREEVLEKDGDKLPGPLGRLDTLKQLEDECNNLRSQVKQLERKSSEAELERIQVKEQSEQQLKSILQDKEKSLAAQKTSFEKSYKELQDMAEKLQQEGKLWRQRYLDLSYQIAQKTGK